jgi:hypothetical protein
MYYGDNEAYYTQTRAAFGNYQGMVAAGTYGGHGGAGGGMAPPDGIQGIGANVRPVTFMPPAHVYHTTGGQYIQPGGFRASLGTVIGYNEIPRNISAYEYRLNAANDAAERGGMMASAGALSSVGVAAGFATGAIGAKAGSFVGAGIGGVLGSIAGPIGTGLGAAAGGVIGGLAGGIAGGIAPSILTAGISDHLSREMEVRNYLENSSFRYIGAGSKMADPRTGTGMNIQSRREIAEFLTKMDIDDKYLRHDDMSRLLTSATESGLMHNTQDIEEFKKRFKEITENVKTVARVLHTSIEEGMKVMKDLRGIGVTDPNEAGQLIMQSDVKGKVAGRTASEMLEIGMQGAELLRGTGVSMDIGFKSAQMNLAAIRSARDAGVLSQEAVAQAGGEEALSQRMVAGTFGFVQSMQGRGALLAAYGRGGTVDATSLDKLARGDFSLAEMYQTGSAKVGDPSELMKFQAYQEKIVSEVGEKYGGRGFEFARLGMATTHAEFLRNQVPGLDMVTSMRYVMKTQMGMSEPEVQASLALIENSRTDAFNQMKALSAVRAREGAEGAERNFVFSQLNEQIHDVYKGLIAPTAHTLGRGIDTLTENSRRFIDERIYNISRADLSAGALSSEDMDDWVYREPRGSDQATLIADLDRHGGGALDILTRTTGEKIAQRLRKGRSMRLDSGIEIAQRERVDDFSGRLEDMKEDFLVLDRAVFNLGTQGDRDAIITMRDFEQMRDMYKKFSMSDKEIEGLDQDSIRSIVSELAVIQSNGKDTKGAVSVSHLAKMLFQKDLKDLTKEEFVALQKGTSGTGELFEAFEEDATLIKGVEQEIKVAEMKRITDRYDTIKTDISKEFGLEKTFFGGDSRLSDEAMTLIGRISKINDPEERRAAMAEAAQVIGAETKQSQSQIHQALSRVLEDEGKKGQLEDLRRDAISNQIGRGRTSLYEHAKETIKESDLKKDAKIELNKGLALFKGALAGGLEDVSTFFADNEGFAADTGLGTFEKTVRNLTGARELEKQLEGADDSNRQGIQEKIVETLRAVDPSLGKAAEERLKDGGNLGNLIEGAFNKEVGQFASTAESAGGVTTPKVGEASSVESFATQVNINKQNLMILQALASRMGVGS